MSHLRFLAVLAPLALLSAPSFAGEEEDEERPAPVRYKVATDIDFSGLEVSASMPSMSATPGGAQDIRYFRDQVKAGAVPHPNVFTPEGLFSEHDLPVPGGAPCAQLLCPVGAAMPAQLTLQPDVRILAQLGFHTDIDAETFHRAPVNLVAVVDKSGSMSGAPLQTVKDSLHRIVDQLGPQDRLAIVLYGDRAHVFMAPTSATEKANLHRQIDGIASAGSTALEDGLRVGFDLAHTSAKGFDGTTRVMLFTDERPNVGRTDAASFMGMAEAASRDGVGMTTIGVGTIFGAELATKVSSVRGGNLFFFPDASTMQAVFTKELDTMVTELAYDMALTVTPAPGLDLAGVYGLPGDAIAWGPDGSITMKVATLFPSKEEGGIYFGFAPEAGSVQRAGAPVATVSLSYSLRSGRREGGSVTLTGTRSPPLGLTRGQLLVEEATVLKRATQLHLDENDTEGAYQLVRGLSATLHASNDASMDKERELVDTLLDTLTKLSGHAGETMRSASRDPVSGLPRR
ncbi:MAG: VWA domain-containing protein [Pseudomonadota bacterium]|nr:VWA domain-containing protein [Pseudomonadota bacterium]